MINLENQCQRKDKFYYTANSNKTFLTITGFTFLLKIFSFSVVIHALAKVLLPQIYILLSQKS